MIADVSHLIDEQAAQIQLFLRRIFKPVRKVAGKLLRTVAPPGAERRARLIREAQALARVSHPNVVSVYEVGEADGQVFIAISSPTTYWSARTAARGWQTSDWPVALLTLALAGLGSHAAGGHPVLRDLIVSADPTR